MMNAYFADGLELLTNISAQHHLESVARGIDLCGNTIKTEYMCFKQKEAISTLRGKSLKFVDKFTYLDNNISSTESDSYNCIEKAWTTMDMLSII